uniref:Uncharacterized protein n=1 Tax=Anopheles atroparvus TaxID=41427 RepID=A0A182JD68_ANOAO
MIDDQLDGERPELADNGDLGIWLDSALTFDAHLDAIVAKANKSLGFITRLASEIRDPLCLKALYCCWVRCSLDYAAKPDTGTQGKLELAKPFASQACQAVQQQTRRR